MMSTLYIISNTSCCVRAIPNKFHLPKPPPPPQPHTPLPHPLWQLRSLLRQKTEVRLSVSMSI
jgi:hypothetical protein